MYTKAIKTVEERAQMNEKGQTAKLVWRITCAHTIAYFLAGIFAMAFMNYEELFVTVFSSFMRPTTEPIVALGAFLQIFRGILLALIFLPMRKVFFEEKYGLLKLGLINIGLAYLLTFGPGVGSFEGYIYTTIPARYQIVGIPEMLLHYGLFIGILYISQKFAHKKIITISSIILMLLISFMSIVGFFHGI